MSERVKNIARQAGGEFYEGFAGSPNSIKFTEDELQKFAELIVRECTLQVADVRIENDFEPVADVALVKAMQNIRNFFGVEE